jgi:hypothetical protein
MKIKLEKYDTALLLCTKHAKVKLKYDYSEDVDFIFCGEDEILNSYMDIAFVYADSRAVPLSSVRVAHVNSALLDIYAKLQPNKLLQLLKDINYAYVDMYKDKNIKTLIFIKVYGLLQALQMRTLQNNEYIDIYDLDETLIRKKYEFRRVICKKFIA